MHIKSDGIEAFSHSIAWHEPVFSSQEVKLWLYLVYDQNSACSMLGKIFVIVRSWTIKCSSQTYLFFLECLIFLSSAFLEDFGSLATRSQFCQTKTNTCHFSTNQILERQLIQWSSVSTNTLDNNNIVNSIVLYLNIKSGQKYVYWQTKCLLHNRYAHDIMRYSDFFTFGPLSIYLPMWNIM